MPDHYEKNYLFELLPEKQIKDEVANIFNVFDMEVKSTEAILIKGEGL